MKIKNPIVTEIAYKTWCINEYGMDAMFLLEGSEKALLIDTGTGTFNVKELISTLTDKPVTVVLTHGHVDHFGGAGFFEEVYLHESDREQAFALTAEERKDYVRIMNSMSDLFDVSEDDVVVFDQLPKFIPLHDNDSFELGERRITVHETPGHTEGSVSFIDHKERILFSGDACNINTLLMGGTLSTLLHTAQYLESLQPFYDRNYNGHIGYASDVTCVPQNYRVNEDAIFLINELLGHGTEGKKEECPFMEDAYVARFGVFGVRYSAEQMK